MKIITLSLLALIITSCVTTPYVNQEPYTKFIPFGSNHELHPISLEGKTFYLGDNSDCNKHLDIKTISDFRSILISKLKNLGLVQVNDVSKAFTHFGYTCGSEDYSKTEYFLKRTVIKENTKWQQTTTVENDRLRLEVRSDQDGLYGLIEGSKNAKLADIRLHAFQLKNKLDAQLFFNQTIVFLYEPSLEDNWMAATDYLIGQLDIIKEKVPLVAAKELCMPRFGYAWKDTSDDSFKVISVNRGSPADKVGIKINDEIIKINDKLARDFYTLNIKTQEIIINNSPVKIEFKRKNRIYTREIRSALVCTKMN